MDVEGWLAKLESGDWFAQGDAARALGENRDPRGVAPLIRALSAALREQSSSVGVCLAEALGKIGDPEAVPVLCRALREGTPWVRAEAARALGRIGSVEAIEPLCQVLTDGETLVIWRAAEALAELGPSAADPICRILKATMSGANGGTHARQHGAVMTCGRAAQTLGRLGQPESIPILCTLLRHPEEWLVGCAVEALGRIGDPSAIEPLIPLLAPRSPHLRTIAAVALGRLGESRSLMPLLEALPHSPRDLRLAAAEALETLGHPGARGPIRRRLLPLIGERDAEVTAALRRALARLESVTGADASRPIPASAPPADPEALPVPSKPGSPAARDLPKAI